MKLSLIVLRTPDPEKLQAQYCMLGIEFQYHRHGSGPFHYSAELVGLILEIYPLSRSQEKADPHLRLGFTVANLDELIPTLLKLGWKVLSGPQKTEWGYTAVVQDMDGRKVELTETKIP